jgi:hypothetical protein
MDCGGAAIQAWPRNRSERLRPHKGGGGGDGGAGEREAQRQQRIAAATDQINAIFNGKVKNTTYRNATFNDAIGGRSNFNQIGQAVIPVESWVDGDPANSRQVMYDQQKSAVYDLNKAEVDRQAQVAERANRFGLARSGLVGGSADVDSNAELNRRTNEGLIRTGGIADQSAADLKLQDEKTRSNLISMAQSGIDTGSAATMALNGLSVNADQAAAQRNGATIGSLFGDLSQAYLVNQQAAGVNSAYNPYATNQFIGSQTVRGNGDQGKTL